MLTWLELHEPPVRNVILPELMKAASLAPPFVLVLDDAHALRNPQCWRVVEALGEGLSTGSSLVICGRSDPPLPASRLRSQDRLSAYDFDDLAFDRDEVARLLDLHGLACDERTADELLRGHGRVGGGRVSRRARLALRRLPASAASLRRPAARSPTTSPPKCWPGSRPTWCGS